MPAARTSIEQRRGSKPLVEKKRRARINQSLAELQALVVDTKKKQGSKQSRVEKADILEMTVRHLQAMQKQQREEHSHARSNDKFHSGYVECVDEVRRFLANCKYKNSAVLGERLTSHLMVRLPRVHPPTPAAAVSETLDDDEDNDDRTPSSSSSEDSMEETILRRPATSVDDVGGTDTSTPTSLYGSDHLAELSIFPGYLANGQMPEKDYFRSYNQILVTPTEIRHSPSQEYDGRSFCYAPHRSKVIYVNGPVDLSRDYSGTMWRPW